MGPDVETERLLLRRWRRADLDELAGIFSQEAVWRYPFGRGWSRTETADFLDRKIEEGGRAAIDFGFEKLGLEEIVSIYEPANAASRRVMERLDMKPFLDTTHPSSGVALRVYKITAELWRGKYV